MNSSKIKTIEVSRSYSRKIQVESYEPLEVFASLKADCKPEDLDEVSAWLFEECVKQVNEGIKQRLIALGKMVAPEILAPENSEATLKANPKHDEFRKTYREKYHPELPPNKTSTFQYRGPDKEVEPPERITNEEFYKEQQERKPT